MADVEPIETPPEEGVDLIAGGAEAFASFMDTLAPDAFAEEPAEGGAPTGPAAGGDGSPAAPTEGAPAGTPEQPAPAAGTAGEPAVPAAAGTPVEPSAGIGTVDATTLSGDWGSIITGLEARTQKELEEGAVVEVKGEYPKYFDALNKHARELVGVKVPSLTGQGEEILKDSKDAADWQEGARQALWREVKDRVDRKADDTKPMMETLHNSVELFRSNVDLIPGTKQFDLELATEFAAMAKPYELRIDDKLVGYTIPVAGLVTQIRANLVARRAAAAPAAPATPAAPTAQQLRAAEQARTAAGQFTNPEAPQAGIPSRAGNSGEEGEDYSTLYGAFGIKV